MAEQAVVRHQLRLRLTGLFVDLDGYVGLAFVSRTKYSPLHKWERIILMDEEVDHALVGMSAGRLVSEVFAQHTDPDALRDDCPNHPAGAEARVRGSSRQP